jgi:lysozyme
MARRGDGQSVLSELQHVTNLLNEEVIPRLHDGASAGNGDGSGGDEVSEPPDDVTGEPLPREVRRTLESLIHELSSASASALATLFARIDEEHTGTGAELDDSEGESDTTADDVASEDTFGAGPGASSATSVAAAPARRLRLSKRGAQFIAEFEGLRPKLYNDPAGHCTIGIGHLVHRGRCNGSEPAEFKRGISRGRAYQLLQHDARRMEQAVNNLGVPLNQNQFDALVSFTYNLGPAWTVQKTGIRDALKAHRYRDVPREMNKWVNAGGRPLPGLVRRRKAEGRLFASGSSPSPSPGPRVVKIADVQPGKHNNSVLVVQKALKKAVGLDYSSGPGNFGPRTRKAYAAWQRKCGIPLDAPGRPDLKSLTMLGKKYGFKVSGGNASAATPRASMRVPSAAPMAYSREGDNGHAQHYSA